MVQPQLDLSAAPRAEPAVHNAVSARPMRSDSRRARLRRSVKLGPLRPLWAIGRLRPTFLIIGAQRSGTTSLAAYLAQHPSIMVAWRKEVHYFDRWYHCGLPWYLAHFPTRLSGWLAAQRSGNEVAVFEATPLYLPNPFVPSRVAAVDPEMRLIAILRDPIERAFSHYRREQSLGRETLSFEDALDAEAGRLEAIRASSSRENYYLSFVYSHFAYATRGFYLEQLLAWEEVFPRDQILVVPSEELFERPGDVLARVTSFLSLPPLAGGRYEVKGAAPPADIQPATRKRLIERFTEPNAALYEHLGLDLGWSR
jgi:Sulfotransferase domain